MPEKIIIFVDDQMGRDSRAINGVPRYATGIALANGEDDVLSRGGSKV